MKTTVRILQLQVNRRHWGIGLTTKFDTYKCEEHGNVIQSFRVVFYFLPFILVYQSDSGECPV